MVKHRSKPINRRKLDVSKIEEKPFLSETKTSAARKSLSVEHKSKLFIKVDKKKLAAGWRKLEVLKESLAVLEQIAEANRA